MCKLYFIRGMVNQEIKIVNLLGPGDITNFKLSRKSHADYS